MECDGGTRVTRTLLPSKQPGVGKTMAHEWEGVGMLANAQVCQPDINTITYSSWWKTDNTTGEHRLVGSGKTLAWLFGTLTSAQPTL